MSLPTRLEVNAWSGDGRAAQEPGREAARWGAALPPLVGGDLLPTTPADPWDWRHPGVGWGLVLPDAPDLDVAARAHAEDAPEPIRRLVQARAGADGAAPVLRWSDGLGVSELWRDHPNGTRTRVPLVGGRRGSAEGALPTFLLLHGDPETLPWRLQYRLQAVARVGRLDLEGTGLERYVDALLSEWPDAGVDPSSAVVWAVDHGGDREDITLLMRRTIADPLARRLQGDEDLSLLYVGGGRDSGSRGRASAEGLSNALNDTRPALVVTTSHGLTAPLDDPVAMARTVGTPVDAEGAVLNSSALAADGLAAGAVWYAHACCSAGTDAHSSLVGAVRAGGAVDRTLRAITKVGSRVAPLARALLGGPRPIRAFVGHVEPTFDWTLRHPTTGTLLTHSTVQALYDRLYLFRPLGWALERCHRHGPELELLHRQARERFDDGYDTTDEMLAARLTAQDRQSLVILGDPTVALPLLH